MNEIDRKSGLSIFSSSFSDQNNLLSTTPGSVAAAISSALETTAENQHTILSEQVDCNFYQHFDYQQNSYNNTFNNYGGSVKENLVSSRNPQHQPLLLPVAPLSRQDCLFDGGGSSVGAGRNNNDQLLLTSGNNVGNYTNNSRKASRTNTPGIDSAGENHVDDQFTRPSSACSQFLHHQPTTLSSAFSSSSSQMAEKQNFSSNNSGSFISDNSKTKVRDKSDNQKTYPVSHCKEKSATTDNREVDSGGGGGSRVFKPSSKIIDLPEKSTSSSSSHDHHHHSSHHHHHHSGGISRNKDSRIPVGIAVAWQRLVTTSSTTPSVTSTMTTKAMDFGSGNQSKSKTSSSSSPSAIKHPSRPSSASSLKNAAKMSGSHSPAYSSNNSYFSASNPNLSGVGIGGDNNSDILSSTNINNNRPMSACGDAIIGGGSGTHHVPFCPSPAASPALSRPLPSSSVPPNLGYPTGYSSQYPPNPYHHHRSAVSPYLEYSYAAAAAVAQQRSFVVPSPLSSPHHHHHSHPSLVANNGHPYWGLDNTPPSHPPVPLLSPAGISTSPGVASADYLQQLSLQQQQQQMHLHSPHHHHLHQQHLLAATNRQMSSSSSSPSTTSASSSPYNNPYLQFLYPPDAATMNKNPYYDHYFHQQQQHQQQLLLQNQGYLQQQQQSQHPSILTPPVSGGSNSAGGVGVNSCNNSAVSSSNNNANKNSSGNSGGSGFDLLANNNNNISSSSTSSGGGSTHRAIPMQVASPISRTSISSLLSCSPTTTGAGGIRTPTPTASSSTSSSLSLAAASATTTTTAAVTSSAGSSSAFSSFSPTTTTAISSATTSQESSVGSSSHSTAAAPSASAASSQDLFSTSPPTTCTIATTAASSPSPSLFLLHHQQQHPHLFSSSTPALSPKSLTSSTPSPVTVHDFNSGLNVVISSSAAANNSTTTNTTNMTAAARKGATPSPISLTPTRALLSPFPPGSPYSPSPIPSNNNNNNGNYKELLVWKEDISFGATKIKPIPINGHTKETHNSNERGGSLTTPPPLSSPLLSLAHHNNMRNNSNSSSKITSVSTPMSSPSSYSSGQKHDFKRLESLIERRDSESISPLVLYPQHSPATSTTSSLMDSADELVLHQSKLATLNAEEKQVNKTDIDNAHSESQHDDDPTETFCISVKLENPPLPLAAAEEEELGETADECQQRSNNGQDDSFKVMPTTQAMIRHHDVVEATTAADKQEDMKICTMKSEAAQAAVNKDRVDGERKEGVKVEIFSHVSSNADSPSTLTIISCDANNTTTVNTTDSTCDDTDIGERGGGGSSERKNQHGGGLPYPKPLDAEKAVIPGMEPTDDDSNNKNNDVIVEGGNDVPESTLILCSSSNNGSTINFNDTSNKSTDDYFKTSCSSLTNNKDNNHSVNIKDVSFTSGYSSSQEDNNNEQQKQSSSLLMISPPITKATKPTAPSKKANKAPLKGHPVLKKLSLKTKNNSKNNKNKERRGKSTEDKKVKEKLSSMPSVEKVGKTKKENKKKVKDTNDGSFKAAPAATLLLSKPKNSKKKTLKVVDDAPEKNKNNKSKKKTGDSALKRVASMSLLSSSASPMSTSRFKNTSEGSDAADKVSNKKEKKGKRNKKNSGVLEEEDKKAKFTKKTGGGNYDSVEKAKSKRGSKVDIIGKKTVCGGVGSETKVGKAIKKSKDFAVTTDVKKGKEKCITRKLKKDSKLGSQDISQQGGWVPPTTGPITSTVTNNNYHQQYVKTKSDTGSSSYFVSPKMTSVSGDIINNSGNINSSFSTINRSPDHNNASLTSNNSHQQPMAVILQPALQSPSQVTFLITSPTSDRTCGGTSPLRIPAYIPRSGVGTSTTTTTAVVASTDELVGGNGESYNGPATLTLHRDVDALSSTQLQAYYQPPPAITIQYHHSAPATPMTMDAASPASSLDLLATVAQEFGSREDLGKRLSIDGGSSCNASSIGESPPMSPQKSPGAYHHHHQQHHIHQHYPPPPHYPAAPIPNQQKPSENIIPATLSSFPPTSQPPPPPIVTTPSGKRPRSPKKQQGAKASPKVKSRDRVNKNTNKTSNSITVKQASKKQALMMKGMKVGRKEKRTVSDSASYISPVVLLKIPQVPGLCSKKTLQQQQEKAKKAKEKNNSKVKEQDNKATIVTGALPKSKPNKSTNNNKKVDIDSKQVEDNKNKIVVSNKLMSKKRIPQSKMDDNENGKRKTKEDKEKNPKRTAIQALSTSSSSISPSKSLLLLSLPTSTTVTTTTIIKNIDEKQAKKEKEEKTEKVKKEKKTKSEGKPKTTLTSLSSLLSPLRILPLTSSSSTDKIITTTPSPTKDRPSSFYNPPERISAFAKQVISRRSSAAGASPTKLQINNNATSTSPLKQQQQGSLSGFFPIQLQKQQQLPNSPTIKMPQLIPFDVPVEPSTATPSSKQAHSLPVPPSTSTLSSSVESSSQVPKTVNFSKRLSISSSKKSSPTLLPPPLLIPSVSSNNSNSSSHADKKDYCDVNDDASLSLSLEQDKKKTDNNIVIRIGNRSPSSFSKGKASCKERKGKDSENERLGKKRRKEKIEESDEYSKKAKKKNPRPSLKTGDSVVPKKGKTKKNKKLSPSPPVTSRKAPKITITQSPQVAANVTVNTSTSSLAFSPLTPPLTAKPSLELEEVDSGVLGKGHHHDRPSAFACLQVPRGSSTPCSSLASRRSSPSTTNVDEEGETETTTENENENDSNNVWVSDPMFAVSAIKLSSIPSSNQPTDAEEEDSVDDDDSDSNKKVKKSSVVGGRKDSNMPLNKFSIFNYKKQPEATTSILSPDQQQKQGNDKERFLEVKSQLKTFVHFKPKQILTGSKKGHHSIKPCLKAEPVIRSEEEEDDEDVTIDDDEDFHLDMEVASITTQNAPGRGKGVTSTAMKGVAGGSSITATSCATITAAGTGGSGKKRKPSINRNSSSYLLSNNPSTSSHSKKHHGLSTKEIMTKVFSRKVSPDLKSEKTLQAGERKSTKKSKKSSSGCSTAVVGTEMDADDEDDEDELLDIEDHSPLPFRNSKSHSSSHNHHLHQAHHHLSHNTQISMSAAAAAVVANSNTNAQQPTSTTSSSLSSSSLALLSSLSSPSMKKPKKRSARSSTTSSCASTKSISRGNRGHTVAGAGINFRSFIGGSASASATTTPNTRASAAASSSFYSSTSTKEKDETETPGKVELDSVQDLVDEMRILTDIQGLFYTGRLNALQPPDVYGVTLDNERGAPPHLIFSAEEVLEKCLREKKPQPEGLRSGLRICAYWSPQYSGLYPGRVSTDFSPEFDPEKDLIPIEFDDGDTGMIKLKEIRLLSVNHPVREYDPNPLLTLEKKHRKRRHSSATGTSGGCTGDHEEPDCGEPYCAKIGKLDEDDEEDDDDGDHDDGASHQHQSSSKMLYWTWSGLGYKRPKSKKNRNKEFFHGIQRGNEVINVGDAALFISTGNERPFIGRVERFWERKGKKMVNVRWFYHPEEVKASAKRLSNLKYPGALFESPHIDENDVQTIAKKCDVLPIAEFKKRMSGSSGGSLRVAKLSVKSSSKPRDMYYVAGFYDPYTYNLTLKDLK